MTNATGDTLDRALTASHVSEALSSFSLADEPLRDPGAIAPPRRDRGEMFYDDGAFWSRAAHNVSGQRLNFYRVAISEWVARVPGLYWRRDADRLRDRSRDEIESQVGEWATFRPYAKSKIVSGGVGTLRFPPSEDGYRLVTLTTSGNASSGVPALISPDLWDCGRLGEGLLIDGEAVWREMPLGWSAKFPIVAGIRRGCLVVDRLDSRGSGNDRVPIEVHPFSIMEYARGEVLLHDFVYATAQTADPAMHGAVSAFFADYKDANGRHGTYLTAADISEPMWDAIFATPEEMRKGKAAALRVIEMRVTEAMLGDDTADALLARLSQCDVDDLKRLSTYAELDWRSWSEGGRVGDEAIRLVDAARRADKIPALLYALQSEETL